ncbi:bestrophin-like domain [Phaeacidiphilus oryzae]|uniref:bestrophin-like domain n=1 Tax=Phaeacidiphilus oryzae TaxID=348818 RepID=UPI00055C3100|nr:DUF4239 domain-containing protein [Phaeacidiphilus oryzae]
MSWVDLAIVLGSLLAVGVGTHLVQHVVPHGLRAQHNEVAGFVYAAVGVMYAMLVGFAVLTVWGGVDQARQTTFKEADALAGVYWVARELPAPAGPAIERGALQYAHTVLEQEWPLMAGHRSSPAATDQVYAIRQAVLNFDPVGERQRVLYEHAVTHVEDLASERRSRLNEVQDEVPPLLWIVLIAGGVLTVGFTFLFGLPNTTAHMLMVLTLTALVAISLVVIKEMDYPFTGVTKVDPTAFDVFLQRLPPPR